MEYANLANLVELEPALYSTTGISAQVTIPLITCSMDSN